MASTTQIRSFGEFFNRFEHHALFAMKTQGRFGPCAMIWTATGDALFFEMAESASKEQFYKDCVLVCAAYDAKGFAFGSQAWMSSGTPPSQSLSRKEILMLVGETPEYSKRKLFFVDRNESGDFAQVSECADIPLHNMKGGFTKVIPITPLTNEERSQARQLLKQLPFEDRLRELSLASHGTTDHELNDGFPEG